MSQERDETQLPGLRSKINILGWWAVVNVKEGWWVGTEEGVMCFEDFDQARAFNTILWQRDFGPKAWPFRVRKFGKIPSTKRDNSYKPKRGTLEALQAYEKQTDEA